MVLLLCCSNDLDRRRKEPAACADLARGLALNAERYFTVSVRPEGRYDEPKFVAC